ncbi:hypothetical protein HYZ78_04030 [Candidatus Microgenomates bacterium]|nr:hypothetical protein [Candidatus Microgenomates bacterium]
MPATLEREYTRTTPEILPDQIHAFIQIFVKQGDRIGSMTYFLPERISQKETDNLIAGILGGSPDHEVHTPSGGLTFAACEGVDAMGVIRRFIDIPGEFYEIDQRGRWEQLANGVLEEVRDSINGTRLIGPRESVGRTIYGFGFKVSDGEWEGKGMNGQPAYLGRLARKDCAEHLVFLPAMSDTLFNMKDGVGIQVAQDGTVGVCCPQFFMMMTKMNGSKDFSGGGSSNSRRGVTKCNLCGQTYLVSSGHECTSAME